jgi:hypothetical protein
MRIVSVIILVTSFSVPAAIPQRIHIVYPPSETPPAITSLTVDPEVLWPPNHKMVAVSLQVTATGDPSPECRIDSTTSNEPRTVPGEDDWVVTGPLTMGLRAERDGSGNGRVYTINVTCTNTSGAASRTIGVSVPHNQ